MPANGGALPPNWKPYLEKLPTTLGPPYQYSTRGGRDRRVSSVRWPTRRDGKNGTSAPGNDVISRRSAFRFTLRTVVVGRSRHRPAVDPALRDERGHPARTEAHCCRAADRRRASRAQRPPGKAGGRGVFRFAVFRRSLPGNGSNRPPKCGARRAAARTGPFIVREVVLDRRPAMPRLRSPTMRPLRFRGAAVSTALHPDRGLVGGHRRIRPGVDCRHPASQHAAARILWPHFAENELVRCALPTDARLGETTVPCEQAGVPAYVGGAKPIRFSCGRSR